MLSFTNPVEKVSHKNVDTCIKDAGHSLVAASSCATAVVFGLQALSCAVAGVMGVSKWSQRGTRVYVALLCWTIGRMVRDMEVSRYGVDTSVGRCPCDLR